MRIVVVVLVVEAFAIATALHPHWVASRIRYHADSARPRYDVPVDHHALVAAAHILHRSGGTYYVLVPPGAPVLRGNVLGALGLWAPPAIPLAAPSGPGWVLSYRAKSPLPLGLRAARVYRLAPGIALLRIFR